MVIINRNRLYKSLFPAHQKRNPAGASFHPSFGDCELARRVRARVYQLSFLYLPFFQLQVKPKKIKQQKRNSIIDQTRFETINQPGNLNGLSLFVLYFLARFSSTATLSDLYHKTYENCDLSDIDLNSLDPLRDLIDDRLYDSWQRTSYSRDCDIGSFRLPDTSGNRPEWSQGYFSLG